MSPKQKESISGFFHFLTSLKLHIFIYWRKDLLDKKNPVEGAGIKIKIKLGKICLMALFLEKPKKFCLTTFFKKSRKISCFFCRVKICRSEKIKRTKMADRELYLYFTYYSFKEVDGRIRNPMNKTCVKLVLSTHN